MVTGGGTLTANSCTVKTQGNSSAAIRSDRGGGTLTVNKGTYETNGTGSPVVYSTAGITVNDATLTANVSAYYGGELVVKAFAVGAVLPTTYTVKAGYHFAILPCDGATIYIEKV